TFILGEDPITGEQVERNGRNLLYAGLDLLPAGDLFQAVIERLGIVGDLAGYLDARISDLQSLASGIGESFDRFWDGISLSDARDPEAVFDRVANLFHSVVTSIVTFVTNAAVDFLDMIKRIMLREIVAFVRSQIPRLYPLLCVALGHDPVTNEEVPRNGTNILNALLEVSEEGREQRQQMQETGTFARIAGFIDRGIAVFTTAYQQLRAAFSNLWDIVTIESLASPVETFNQIYDQFAAPVTLVTDYIVDVAVEILRVIKEVLMTRLSAYARTVRGYFLVTVIIGRNPFTGNRVSRSIENIIHGFMSLMEGGEQQFQQMKESGAIDRTTARIYAAVDRLNMTPESILQLFIDLWNSFSLRDLAHPIQAFERIVATFGEPIGRLIAFVIEIVKIVVEVILQIMNFPVDLITNIIARTRQAFHLIKSDPAGFLKNLLRAIKQGFTQFFDNILTHLLNGVTGWLMSELQDAGVPVLTDFSLQGVITWVLAVLGISMDKIWEKLAAHPRIGPERVARIRSMIDRLEGIWTFIRDVQERGMAAIWDKIQEQLSNLWDTVLDAVKNWIVDRIINAVVTRLLSMLDPTGIMAVINSAIAIYRAVQSFIRYITQMLQVVNSFVEGVVEIAEGNVTRAANALEGAMDRAMPVVIGFLANQVGLGGVGQRIGEMIERVRELVDRALTWLVNRAVDTGFALIDRALSLGRSAVAGVRGWVSGLLGLERPFTTADNQSHRIFFVAQGDSAELRLNPTPAGKYADKIGEISPPPAPNDRVDFPSPVSVPLQRNGAVVSTVVAQPDSDRKISMATLKGHALTVARHIDGLIVSVGRTSSDASQQAVPAGAAAGASDQRADFAASLDGLSQITRHLLSTSAAGPLPVSPVPTYGGLVGGFASRMTVKPLTKLGVPGTGVGVDSPDYTSLLLRRETPGGRSFYIAGHLLNNNVHGSGSTWQNLTPIAQRTNANHESQVESKVKTAVEHDLILEYTVDVDYAISRKAALLQAIEQTPGWETNSVLSQKHQIIEAEARVPTQLRCTLKQIKADGTDLAAGEPGYDANYNISGAAGTINNEINVPQNSLDNYYLSSAAAVTYTAFPVLKTEAEAASSSGTAWPSFYNDPSRKVSIDHLPDPRQTELQDCFRRQEMIQAERARIAGLTERQSAAAFEGGRVPYTGNITTDTDKADFRARFADKIRQLATEFLQGITNTIQTDVPNADVRWGDYRNNKRLGANLPDDEIERFKTNVFDPRIANLQTARTATAAAATPPAAPRPPPGAPAS
ncbi:MAG TPA: hypothetical protein VHH73_14990, partial [Verrucomicrobiae bacterium]|nr:hypothetical protein [Verrucomicrobiae bacterium]